jgi:hypothetical protein
LWASYRRSLNDGDSLNDLLLVQLGTGTVQVTHNGGHTSLVAHGGGQVDGLLGVILREAVQAGQRAVRNFSSNGRRAYLFTFPL